MKTLKIKESTHQRLTRYKAIINCKNYDRLINILIDVAREHDFEYKELTFNEYEALGNGDK